jgi:hypothetical protein
MLGNASCTLSRPLVRPPQQKPALAHHFGSRFSLDPRLRSAADQSRVFLLAIPRLLIRRLAAAW